MHLNELSDTSRAVERNNRPAFAVHHVEHNLGDGTQVDYVTQVETESKICMHHIAQDT